MIISDSSLSDKHKPLFIVAHPDDESTAFGGLIQCCLKTGVLVTLTRGEMGNDCSSPKSMLTLAERRTKELKNACIILGLKKNVFVYDFKDGGLDKQVEDIKKLVTTLLLTIKPCVIVTQDFKSTSHSDHRILSRVIVDLTRRPPVFLQYLPCKTKHNISQHTYTTRDFNLMQVLGRKESFCLKLDNNKLATKRRAMCEHKSQLPEMERIASNLLGYEYYRYVS